jgi:hypothetical protein
MVEAMAPPAAADEPQPNSRSGSPAKEAPKLKSRPSSKEVNRPSSNGATKRLSGAIGRETASGGSSRRASSLGKGRPSSREKSGKGPPRASAQENGATLDSLVEPPKPMPGIESLFLTGTTLKIVGLEEGGALEANALKELPLKILLDDIQFRGAISDFHPIREKLKVGT